MMNHSARSRVICRRSGAVSLLICLCMGAISFILLLSLQAAQARAGEVHMIRAANAVVEANLASYDPSLLAYFGLWGVRSEHLSPKAFNDVLAPWQTDAKVFLEASGETLAAEHLSAQISSYMQVRAPAGWLTDYLTGIRQIFDEQSSSLPHRSSGLKTGDMTISPFMPMADDPCGIMMTQGMTWSDLTDIQSFLQDNILCHTPISLTALAVNRCIDWILSPVLEPLQDALMSHVSQSLEGMIEQNLPVFPGDFGEEEGIVFPVLYRPDQLTEMAGLAERLLIPTQHQLAQRFLLAEYGLSCFVSNVPVVSRGDDRISLVTPGGIRHDQLGSERQGELERIITGQPDPAVAQQRIKGNLIMVRSVLRMIEVLTDADKLQTYRPAANLLVTLIASVSSGTVMLDPEWVVWLIAAADAARMAALDYEILLSGKTVNLWQSKETGYLPMYYHDYLRLFLLIIPQPQLIDRIGNQIHHIYPGQYLCEIRAEATWRNQQYEVTASYE